MTQSCFDRRAILRVFPAAVGALFGIRALASSSASCAPTSSDIPGPFYIGGAPWRTRLAGSAEKGARLRIHGTVFASDCRTPLTGALLDVWHADADGSYHGANEQYRLRGQVLTDSRGRYDFETIRPGHYRLDEGWRPAHIHFTVSSPGHGPLTTQLYFRGDPYLPPHDACADECHANDPHRIISLAPDGSRLAGQFDIVLKTKRA
jgi:catechol 1,2-dioxygenase